MSFSNQAVYLAGNQVDACQKRQGSVPLVFVIATYEALAALGCSVRMNVADRLDAGLLVV